MAIYGSNTTGLSVRANTNTISGTQKWLKIARVELASSNDAQTSISTFLVNMTGNETVSGTQTDNSFLITAKYTTSSLASYYVGGGTSVHVETLVANDLDSWDASTHLAMVVNSADTNFAAEVWVRSPAVTN